MTIKTTWRVSADTIATYTDGNENKYTNVVTEVHWRCTATDSDTGETATIYGSKALPRPTSPKTFIDLTSLQAMDTQARRAAVIRWAESIEPGFLADQEAKVTERLQAKLDAPAPAFVDLL